MSAALDVWLPPGSEAARARLEALLDDFHPSAIEESASDRWRVHFFSSAARDGAREAIQGQLPDLGISVTTAEVSDEDWAARSQANLRAIRIDNIIVAPPWDLPKPRGAGVKRRAPAASPPPVGNLMAPVVIVIEPSMGFGTAHHQSTRLCLRLLQRLDVRGRTALDIGTGSGILAIAAWTLGATEVSAVDDDPDAMASARRSLSLNSAEGAIALTLGDARTLTLEPADIVLANLTASLLIGLAARLTTLTKPGGWAIVSGFTLEDEAPVASALTQGHAIVASREIEDEWVAMSVTNPARVS